MNIRPAKSSDSTSLAALSIEVWLNTYLKRGISDPFARYVLSEFTPENFYDLISGTRTQLIVFEVPDGLEGFVQVADQSPAPDNPKCDTEIQKLYVRSNQHRKGIGQALLQASLNLCAKKGVGSVWLATNSENSPAIGFYLANGFNKTGVTEFRLGTEAYPNIIFRRDLTIST